MPARGRPAAVQNGRRPRKPSGFGARIPDLAASSICLQGCRAAHTGRAARGRSPSRTLRTRQTPSRRASACRSFDLSPADPSGRADALPRTRRSPTRHVVRVGAIGPERSAASRSKPRTSSVRGFAAGASLRTRRCLPDGDGAPLRVIRADPPFCTMKDRATEATPIRSRKSSAENSRRAIRIPRRSCRAGRDAYGMARAVPCRSASALFAEPERAVGSGSAPGRSGDLAAGGGRHPRFTSEEARSEPTSARCVERTESDDRPALLPVKRPEVLEKQPPPLHQHRLGTDRALPS